MCFVGECVSHDANEMERIHCTGPTILPKIVHGSDFNCAWKNSSCTGELLVPIHAHKYVLLGTPRRAPRYPHQRYHSGVVLFVANMNMWSERYTIFEHCCSTAVQDIVASHATNPAHHINHCMPPNYAHADQSRRKLGASIRSHCYQRCRGCESAEVFDDAGHYCAAKHTQVHLCTSCRQDHCQ